MARDTSGYRHTRPGVDLPTTESVDRARWHQLAERLTAAREMGVPSQLVDLYQVHGVAQVEIWNRMVKHVLTEH